MTTSQCPFYPDDCRAANPRQVAASADALRDAGVNEAWIIEAQRCQYCQGVWTYGPSGGKIKRGTLDDKFGWIPYRRGSI